MKTLTLFTLILLAALALNAQVAINNDGSNPDPSAVLDVKSDTAGILIPRMTKAQRNAITSPATGLLVFDTDENSFYYYDGSIWTPINSGTVKWNFSGSNITAADTTYSVGVGTTTPTGVFEVATVKHNNTFGSDECTGGTASASSHYTTYTPDKAFDNHTYTEWLNNNSLPAYLQYDLGAGNDKRIAKYRIYYEHPSSYDHSPNDWTFEASNDGTTWITLDTKTGQGWSANKYRDYPFSNTTHYRYYRLNITDNKGVSDDYVQINEMEMMEENLSNHATLYVNDKKVGIGTSSPAATLDVSGTMKLTDGHEGSGKVLVSNASGNASWADGATVNGGGWTVSGNHIYNTSDSVGVGTASPGAKLEVNGIIKMDDASTTNPQAGMIRWNSTTQDFEGYNGTGWVSLSKSGGGWGANPTYETAGVTSSDGAVNDNFGYSVSIDGDNAIVGASNKYIGGHSNQGKAYIFHHNGTSWTQQAGITASDGDAGDVFGYSVSIDGDYAIVGAAHKDIGGHLGQGKAYIFHYDGGSWVQQGQLTTSDGVAYDNFGCSVSISGDYAIVGADNKTILGQSSQGKAYIFHYDGSSWVQQGQLTASDGAAWDNFGHSVSISGNYAIVGAEYKDIGSKSNQGKAYIFFFDGSSWTEQPGLTASDGAAIDNFGHSVSISGDDAIVGAYEKIISGNSYQGKAYIFHRSGSTWTEQAGLTASDGSQHDYFGWSVSISGDYAVVGADNKDVGANDNQGKAYIFYRSGSTWTEQVGLTASDGSQNDSFGWAVSINGDYTIVGAYLKTIEGNSNQGKAYFYKRD